MSSLSRGTKAELFSILPAGTVLPFAGATAPDGWAICNGNAISRTDYPELFLAIGETWGNGDGSTTFNLPDLEGRFLRGADNSSGIDPDADSRVPLGNGVAEGVGSLQNDATKRPNVDFGSNLTGDHSHFTHSSVSNSNLTPTNTTNPLNNGVPSLFQFRRTSSGTANHSPTNSTGNHSHSITTGGDVESRPSNCSVNYIIKL